jgi:hypothetical protein
MNEKKDEYINGVKIQKLPTRGRPMSYKTSKWKPTLNVSANDLKALQKTIRAAEEKEKK